MIHIVIVIELLSILNRLSGQVIATRIDAGANQPVERGRVERIEGYGFGFILDGFVEAAHRTKYDTVPEIDLGIVRPVFEGNLKRD